MHWLSDKSFTLRSASITIQALVCVITGPLLDALAEPLLGMANGDAPEAQDRNLSDAEDRSKLQLRACLGVMALSTAVLKAKRLRHTSTANGRQEPAGSNHQQIAVAEASDARSYVQLPASLQSALPDIAARLCLAVAVVEEPWPDDGSETAVAEEHPGQADGYPSQECQEAAMLALLGADGSLAGGVLCCLAKVRGVSTVTIWPSAEPSNRGCLLASILQVSAPLHKRAIQWLSIEPVSFAIPGLSDPCQVFCCSVQLLCCRKEGSLNTPVRIRGCSVA